MGVVWDDEKKATPEPGGATEPQPDILSGPGGYRSPFVGVVADQLSSESGLGHTLDLFGQGVKDDWGTDNFLDAYQKKLKEFDEKADTSGWRSLWQPTMKAINEGLTRPAAMTLSVGLHGITGTFAGLANTGPAGREIASIPEAFMGNPGNLLMEGGLARMSYQYRKLKPTTDILGPPSRVTGGIHDEPNLPVAHDLGVIGPPRPAITQGTPADAAKNAVQPLVAYHGSPYSFDAFSSDKIGTGEGAQSYGYGHYVAENPKVAEEYSRTVTQKLLETPEDAAAAPGNHYQVRIHADQEKMLDWDKPLSEQTPYVQGVLKTVIKAKDYDWSKTSEQFHRDLGRGTEVDKYYAKLLADAGIPGIKYLDQGSRVDPMDVAEKQWMLDVRKNEHKADNSQYSAERLKQAQDELADAQNRPTKTRNYVIFNDKDIEITHKNGVPVAPQLPAVRRTSMTPETNDASDEAWQARFEQSVSKLKTTDEAKQIILDAANRQDMGPARRGEIPAAHMEQLQIASGAQPGQIDPHATGLLLKNDKATEAAVAAMLTASDAVSHAAEALRSASTTENRIAFQEAILRHNMIVDAAVEQYVGRRAQWGREGNSLQKFMEAVNDDKTLSQHLNEYNNSGLTDLDALANKIGQLEPRTQLPRMLQDARKPTFADDAIWFWQNAVLSGQFTHAAYFMANKGYALTEAALVTPVAAAIGGARRILTGADQERVLFGETPAAVWGMIAGAPDAIVAAAEAVKTGAMTPLPREISNGVNLFGARPPIPGTFGKVVGAPMAVASGIHTYDRFIGYRSTIEKEAYRRAINEGLSPLSQEFWEKRSAYAAYPSEATMDRAIEHGDKMTFTTDLGPKGKAFKAFLQQFKLGKLIVPFIHIPANIVKAAQEMTPIAALDKSQGMRAALKGDSGPIARDMAWARLSVGSAAVAAAVNWGINDELTGSGPVNKQARDEWLLTHQPYSIKIGDKWVRYDRTGPLGILLGWGGDLASLGHDIIKDHEYEEAANHVVVSIAHTLVDETGMGGLSDIIRAKQDPDHFGTKWVANFAASWLPMSSFLGQTAAWHDPFMRETHGMIEALKYKIPYVRESLKPFRDWSGMPLHNPHETALLRSTPVNQDPVDLEIERLQFHPTRVPNYIGDPQKGTAVTLGEDLYDEYQNLAGPVTRSMLMPLVTSPGFREAQPFVRENMIHMAIKEGRRQAAVAMQARYPQIIQQGVQQKIDAITRPEEQHKPLTKPKLEP